jgi:hypothetical protein
MDLLSQLLGHDAVAESVRADAEDHRLVSAHDVREGVVVPLLRFAEQDLQARFRVLHHDSTHLISHIRKSAGIECGELRGR